jgi:hypothetical protein
MNLERNLAQDHQQSHGGSLESRPFPTEDLTQAPRLGDGSARNCLPPIQPVTLKPLRSAVPSTPTQWWKTQPGLSRELLHANGNSVCR